MGGKGDRSYNDSAFQGVRELRSRGYDVREFEPPSPDTFERGLELLVRQRAQLIICVGFYYDAVIERASRRLEVDFAVLDGAIAPSARVLALKFDTHNGSFLAGAVAAAQSRSLKLAFMGGLNQPIINEFRDGFVEGARFIRPEVECQSLYVGATPAAFSDPARAHQLTTNILRQGGADLIFAVAGASGAGVIRAAIETNQTRPASGRVEVIGVDVDQSHLGQDVVLTSMLKNFGHMAIRIAEQYKTRTLALGTVVKLGLKEDAVGLAPLAGFAREEARVAAERALVNRLAQV